MGSTGETVLLSAPVACSRGTTSVANTSNRIFRRARIGFRTWRQHGTCYHDRGGFAAKFRTRHIQWMFPVSILRTRNIVEPLDACARPNSHDDHDRRSRPRRSGVARAIFLFSHGTGLRGRRFPRLRADLLGAARPSDLLGKSGGSLPRSPVLHLDRVLRAFKAGLRHPAASPGIARSGSSACRLRPR